MVPVTLQAITESNTAIFPMIKLLAIDIDGTLLTRDRTVPAKVAESIEAAREAGITVLLASGRIRTSMMKFAEPLELHTGPMICGNGTNAILSADEEILYRPIRSEAQALLLEYAAQRNLHVNLYTRDRLFFARETSWGEMYRTRVDTVTPETLAEGEDGVECLKVMLVDHPANIQSHFTALAGQMSEFSTRATESEPEYLEFMDQDATKGSALELLASRLGVAREETAAIGDYLNDEEMLRWAGLSAAVENAHPRIKTVAQNVVSSSDEGGVAEFIERFVLKHS